MLIKTSRNSLPSAGQNPATTQSHALSQELLRELSARGIDPDSLPNPHLDVVGISSALGPSEYQQEIDQWIDDGGYPKGLA